MIVFVPVVIAAATGFWALQHRSRKLRSAPILLSAMPLALLFLIAPVPIGAVRAVLAFQALGRTGQASINDAAAIATSILRPLWFGSWGFVVALAVVTGIQRRLAQSPRPETPVVGWGNWIILLSLLLIVPAGILTFIMQEVPTLLMQAAAELPSGAEAMTPAADATIAHASQAISSRLVVAGLSGFPMLFFAVVLGIANVIGVGFSRSSDRLDRLSWFVGIIVGTYAVWSAIAVTLRLYRLG